LLSSINASSHGLEQGGHKQWQMLPVNPCPPTRGREKGGKGRETYKLYIKTALLITLIIIRGIKQNRQNQY